MAGIGAWPEQSRMQRQRKRCMQTVRPACDKTRALHPARRTIQREVGCTDAATNAPHYAA